MKEIGFVGVGEAMVGRIFVLEGGECVCVKLKRNYERKEGEKGSQLQTDTGKVLLLLLESLSVETSVKVSNGKLFLISNACMTNSSDFFRAFRGEISPPKQ